MSFIFIDVLNWSSSYKWIEAEELELNWNWNMQAKENIEYKLNQNQSIKGK